MGKYQIGIRAAKCFAAALAVTTLLGCGNKISTYSAGGKVVFPDGTPLTSGVVTFRVLEDDKSPTARGTIRPDGTFELSTFAENDGAVEGHHAALVMVFPPPERGQPQRQTKAPQLINGKFSKFETSGLSYDVTRSPSQNRYEIIVSK